MRATFKKFYAELGSYLFHNLLVDIAIKKSTVPIFNINFKIDCTYCVANNVILVKLVFENNVLFVQNTHSSAKVAP